MEGFTALLGKHHEALAVREAAVGRDAHPNDVGAHHLETDRAAIGRPYQYLVTRSGAGNGQRQAYRREKEVFHYRFLSMSLFNVSTERPVLRPSSGVFMQ